MDDHNKNYSSTNSEVLGIAKEVRRIVEVLLGGQSPRSRQIGLGLALIAVVGLHGIRGFAPNFSPRDSEARTDLCTTQNVTVVVQIPRLNACFAPAQASEVMPASSNAELDNFRASLALVKSNWTN